MQYSLLLPDNGWGENIRSDASMLLSDGNTQQTLLSSFFPELPAHLAILLPSAKQTQNQGHTLNPPQVLLFICHGCCFTLEHRQTVWRVQRQLYVTAKKQGLNHRVCKLQVYRWHWHCRDTNCKTSLNSCFQCITWQDCIKTGYDSYTRLGFRQFSPNHLDNYRQVFILLTLHLQMYIYPHKKWV